MILLPNLLIQFNNTHVTVDSLKKRKSDELHLLVHDECHWGIQKKSQINIFLEEIKKEITKDPSNAANILILLVTRFFFITQNCSSLFFYDSDD